MSRVRGITPVLGLVVGCAFLGWIAATSAQQRSAESDSAPRPARETETGRWRVHQSRRSYTEGREVEFDEQIPILLDSETGNSYVLFPVMDSKREENENDPGYSWIEIPRHSMEDVSGELYHKRSDAPAVHRAAL